MAQQRVVSLIASATEIVCALDCAEMLVGRSHECDFPASVQKLPRCTAPKFNTDGTSREIDEHVRKTLSDSPVDALSVYHVFTNKLKELQPDLILTQSQCDVCAVSLSDVERALCDWMSSAPSRPCRSTFTMPERSFTIRLPEWVSARGQPQISCLPRSI